MNGMELREMDKIIYPVCTLCRDHEKAGFMEGVKVVIRLRQEMGENKKAACCEPCHSRRLILSVSFRKRSKVLSV